jgi:hypothetical protein
VDFRKIAATFIAFVVLAGFAGSAAAQDEETEIAVEDLQDAEAVCQKHRAELMKIPHVRVVTAEIDPRKDAVILVMVDDPENADEVTRKLPSRLEGFPVEVGGNYAEKLHSDFPVFEHGATHPPTVDKQGYYHHAWLEPASPAATPGASR